MIQWELQSVIVDFLLSKFLNDQSRYYYDVYELIYNIINFWKQYKKCVIIFYKINFENSNIIFDMSILTNQKIIIHSTTFSWRFKINIKKFKLFKFKEFVKNLKNQINIYVLVVVNVNITKKKLKSFEIYLYLQELFDNEKAEIWFEQN